MLSSDQKKELIEDIKRPIRYYRVSLSGYGGEVVYGKSSKEEYDYWVTNKDLRIVDLKFEEDDENPFQTYMFEKEDTPENYESVPKNFQREYSWHDNDDIDHTNGSEYGNTYLEIIEVDSEDSDANEIKPVFESGDLDSFLDKHGTCIVEQSDAFKEDYVFYSMSVEKGTFFQGIITTTGRIDLDKLKFSATEFPNGDVIVHTVEYEEEYVDGADGWNTSGKAMYIELQEL